MSARFSPRKFTFLAGLLALLLAAMVTEAADLPGASPKIGGVGVEERVKNDGSARVIVGLMVPNPPEELPEETKRQALRAAIAQAQKGVLKRVGGPGAGELRRFREIPFMSMEVNAQGLAKLLADAGVVSVEEDLRLEPHLTDTPAIVRAVEAWAAGYTGQGQTVAVLDTGVDTSHPFFAGKIAAEACFSTPGGGYTSYCPNGQAQQVGPGAGTYCPDLSLGCYHGTHVSGIAVGKEGQLAGGAGMAPAALLVPIQVFARGCDYSGCWISTDTGDLVAAMEWVYDQRNTYDIAAVNMSLGSGGYPAPCDDLSPAMTSAINLLRSVDIATVVSSGNNGYLDRISFPACISTAVSVGATTKDNQVSSFSNAAPFLSLLAPGSSILSADVGGGYAYHSGTSMAAPHVTGAWAVLKGAKPTATVAQVLDALTITGLPITDPGQGLVKPLIQIGDTTTSQGALGYLLSSVANVNHALAANGGMASASSVHSAAFPVAAVIDGDRTGAMWGAGGGWNDATKNVYPDWVQIDFSGPKVVNEIDVVTLQDDYLFPTEPIEAMMFSLYGITAFQVQYWNGGSWVTVTGGNVSGNSNVWRRFSFEPLTTQRIRVVVNASLAAFSRVVEIEAWGPLGQSNQLPTVNLTAPSSGANFVAPADITLSANAADPDGSVAKVEFFAGSTSVGTDLTAPYGTVWYGVPAGSYSLTAVATDNLGATTTSTPVTITVSGGGALVNHALAANGGAATASSVYSPGYPVAAVNNGDRTGAGWGSGGGWNDATKSAFPDWVRIDFGGPRSISEIDVITLQDNYANPIEPTEATTFSLYGITSFQVQYWDGSLWVTVPGGSVTGNSSVWRHFSFAPLTTRYVRVLVNAALASYSRIVEIEAWGEPSVTTVNHALAANGGVAAASSVHSGSYPVSAVNNGDRAGIGWGSGGGWNDGTKNIYPDWVQIEFGGPKSIGEIDVVTLQDNYAGPAEPTEAMTFNLYGITAFDVQYWDGSSWITIPGGNVVGNNQVWRRFNFVPVTTTKCRVLVNASLGGGWSRIVEVEAWGAP